ncbi:MAG: hypothetical protein IKP40_11085 [Clostridia bacterium]|nr:hypothetical protein [Clostridia bacterium]
MRYFFFVKAMIKASKKVNAVNVTIRISYAVISVTCLPAGFRQAQPRVFSLSAGVAADRGIIADQLTHAKQKRRFSSVHSQPVASPSGLW